MKQKMDHEIRAEIKAETDLLRQNFEWAMKYNENSDKNFDALWNYFEEIGENPIYMINLFIHIIRNSEKI